MSGGYYCSQIYTSGKTRVRVTSETVVVDAEIQHQRQRARRIRKVLSNGVPLIA